MIVPNQKLEIKWRSSTMQWYKDKGYIFTKFGDHFLIKAEDVSRRYGGKIKVKCDICGTEKEISASSYFTNIENDKDHLYYCQKCSHIKLANIYKLSPDKVVDIVNSKNGNTLLNPEEYINSNTANLRIICGSCGNEFITSLASIRNANGACIECALKKTRAAQLLSPDEVERRINSVNGNILLNKNAYIKNNVRNLKIKCGKCGKVFTTSLSNYTTFNVTKCPSCTKRISKGEEIIMNVLEKYDVNYIFQMKFNDCRDKRKLAFDFYFPDYNACCEFDGQLHYIPKYGEESFKKTKLHDAMKDWYCRWNNINLLRIPYWEGGNIEQILIDYLNLKPQSKIKHISNKKSA